MQVTHALLEEEFQSVSKKQRKREKNENENFLLELRLQAFQLVS